MDLQSLSGNLWMRPACAEDESFLYRLYATTREEEFAAFGEMTKHLLLEIQYRGQRTTYQTQYPGAGHWIVLLNRQPIGRLWVDRKDGEHRLVDITLLPEHRNAGIGTQLLREQMRKAAEAAAPLRVSVLQTNTGSLRFHTRLGFSVTGEDQVYVQLEWRHQSSRSQSGTIDLSTCNHSSSTLFQT